MKQVQKYRGMECQGQGQSHQLLTFVKRKEPDSSMLESAKQILTNYFQILHRHVCNYYYVR